MKLTSFWMIFAVLVTTNVSADTAQTVEATLVPADQINQTAWVGNAIYQSAVKGAPEDLVLGQVIVQIYRNDPQADPMEVLNTANQIRSQYRAQGVALSGEAQTMTQVADTIAAVAKLIPGGDRFTDIISQYGKWSAVAYDGTIGKENQIVRQMANYEKYSAFADPATAWENVWSMAHASSQADLAINTFFADELNADTKQSSSQILERNPQFAANAAILKMTGPNGDLAIAKNEIQKSLSQLNGRIDGVVQADLKIQSELDQVLANQADEVAAQKAQAEAEARRQQEQIELQGARSSVYILSVLGGVVDPKLARPISVVGNAAIQIADSFSHFSSSSATAAGSAILTGNVLGAALSVASLFDTGPTPDQLILEQIRGLSRQISDLSKQMSQRFDRIDHELSEIMTSLDRNFARIAAGVSLLHNEVVSIERALLKQRGQIEQLSRDVFGLFYSTLNVEFVGRLEQCLDSDGYAASFRMAYKDYRQCATDFRTHSIEVSQAGLPNLDGLNVQSYASIASALKKAPLEANLGLLNQFAGRVLGNPLLSSDQAIPNPVEWAKGAQAYMDLAANHPEYARLTDMPALNRILETGTLIDRVSKNVVLFAMAGGAKPNYGLFYRLLQAYRDISEQIVAQVEAMEKNYSSDPARELDHGIDFWADHNQSADGDWGRPTQFTPCAGSPNSGAYWAPLSAAPELIDAMTPVPVRNAIRARAVRSEYCFTAKWILNPGSTGGWIAGISQIIGLLSVDVYLKVEGRAVTHRHALSSQKGAAQKSFPDPSEPNTYTAIDVSNYWNSNFNMASAIMGTPNDFGDLGAEALMMARWKTDQRLDQHRRSFSMQVEQSLDGNLNASVSELEAVKTLIESYVQLGLPLTWNRNDRLRALLRGEKGIFDKQLLQKYLRSSVFAARSENLKEAIAQTTDALEKELSAAIQAAPNGETLPSLDATLRRLQDMKKDCEAVVPKKPIADVLKEIRSKLATFRRT